jgi:hypothetical protein
MVASRRYRFVDFYGPECSGEDGGCRGFAIIEWNHLKCAAGQSPRPPRGKSDYLSKHVILVETSLLTSHLFHRAMKPPFLR